VRGGLVVRRATGHEPLRQEPALGERPQGRRTAPPGYVAWRGPRQSRGSRGRGGSRRRQPQGSHIRTLRSEESPKARISLLHLFQEKREIAELFSLRLEDAHPALKRSGLDRPDAQIDPESEKEQEA
jgi:hypothetical protein